MRYLFASALAISFIGTSMGTLYADKSGLIPKLLKQEGYTHDEWMQFWNENIEANYIATKRHLFKQAIRIAVDLRDSYISSLSRACLRIESFRLSSDVSGGNGSSRKKERPYSYLFFLTAYNLHSKRSREVFSRSRGFAKVLRKLFDLAALPQLAIRVDDTIPRASGNFDWISNLMDESLVPRFAIALVSAYAIDLLWSPNLDPVNMRYMRPPQVNRLIPLGNELGQNKHAIFVCMMDATRIPDIGDRLEFVRVRNWLFNGGRSSNEHIEYHEPASYDQCLLWTLTSAMGA